MRTPSFGLHESLFTSDQAQDWAQAGPRGYTRRQMEALLPQLTNLGFQRLRWTNVPTRVIYPVGSTPWDSLPSTFPPKEGLNHQARLALDIREGGSSGRWMITPGFLKWNDRWYFSPDGDNCQQTVSDTTLWRLRLKA